MPLVSEMRGVASLRIFCADQFYVQTRCVASTLFVMPNTETTSRNDLGTAPVQRLFFRFYVPSLISMASIAAHQVINGIILGQQVGKEALGAIGLYTPVLLLFIAFVLSIMIGGGILFARHVGGGRLAEARHVFEVATTLVLGVGTVAALSAPWITAPLVSWLAAGQSPIMVQYTTECTYWNLLFTPFFLIRVLWGGFLSNDNAPGITKNATVLAAILNIVLDLVLVVVFPYGVAGAAIATGLALLVAVVYLAVAIERRKGHLSLRRFRLGLRFTEWPELFRLGFPSFVSEVSVAFGFFLINRSLLPYGALAVSAFGVVNLLSNLFLRLFTAAMLAIQPIMAYNIGARQPHRVLETLRFALLFTFMVGVGVYLIGFFGSDLLINIVSADESDEFKQVATRAIMLSFILFAATGPNYVLVMYIQIIGQATLSTLTNVVRGFLLIALLLLVLPEPLGMHLNGVWLARPLAEVLLLLGLGLFLWYRRDRFFSDDTILRTRS